MEQTACVQLIYGLRLRKVSLHVCIFEMSYTCANIDWSVLIEKSKFKFYIFMEMVAVPYSNFVGLNDMTLFSTFEFHWKKGFWHRTNVLCSNWKKKQISMNGTNKVRNVMVERAASSNTYMGQSFYFSHSYAKCKSINEWSGLPIQMLWSQQDWQTKQIVNK